MNATVFSLGFKITSCVLMIFSVVFSLFRLNATTSLEKDDANHYMYYALFGAIATYGMSFLFE